MRNTALLIIDVQVGLDSPALGQRNILQAEDNMTRLLTTWRALKYPVVHVKHNSTETGSTLRPELPGNAIKAQLTPIDGEPFFEKTVNSAFIGTELEGYLHKIAIDSNGGEDVSGADPGSGIGGQHSGLPERLIAVTVKCCTVSQYKSQTSYNSPPIPATEESLLPVIWKKSIL